MKKQVNLEKIDGLETILEFLHPRNSNSETWHRGGLLHKKELVDAFDENETNEGREIGTGHAACLQSRKDLFFYVVDVWTATGSRVTPDQQAIIRSVRTMTYWNDHKA